MCISYSTPLMEFIISIWLAGWLITGGALPTGKAEKASQSQNV